MDASMIYRDIRPFLQEDGRLTALPVKRRKQLTALYYLSTKFESGRTYTEGEVNDLLDDLPRSGHLAAGAFQQIPSEPHQRLQPLLEGSGHSRAGSVPRQEPVN